MSEPVVPGWYGKLPTLGDFASRRLAAEFIDPWDVWLGDGLSALRETLGPEWLDAYLHSPVWRFVLMPGLLPGVPHGVALAGVLMPSVDRVGRYFPLTLAAPLAQAPRSAGEVEALLGWLHWLEDVALDALQDDWDIEALEQVLAQQPLRLDAASASPAHLADAHADLGAALGSDAAFVAIDAVQGRGELARLLTDALAQTGESHWPRALAGHAFWLADNPSEPRLLVSRGLPGHGHFIQMLGSSAREPGATTIF